MSAIIGQTQCSRCHKFGHSNKACPLPFMRTHTIAELRQQQHAEALQRRSEYEERQAARDARRATRDLVETETRRQRKMGSERKSPPAGRSSNAKAWNAGDQDWDAKSSCSTVSTAAPTVLSDVDVQEVKRLAAMDKEVRKLEKVLRDIERLQTRTGLDVLQKAKLARKPEVELELESAKGIAEARARNQLRNGGA